MNLNQIYYYATDTSTTTKNTSVKTKMEALRTVLMLLGCGVTLLLLPGSEATAVGSPVSVAGTDAEDLPYPMQSKLNVT